MFLRLTLRNVILSSSEACGSQLGRSWPSKCCPSGSPVTDAHSGCSSRRQGSSSSPTSSDLSPHLNAKVCSSLLNYSSDSREGLRCELWLKRPSGPDSKLVLPWLSRWWPWTQPGIEALALSASQRNSMTSLACFSPLSHSPLGLSLWLLPCHSPEGSYLPYPQSWRKSGWKPLSPLHRKVVLISGNTKKYRKSEVHADFCKHRTSPLSIPT